MAGYKENFAGNVDYAYGRGVNDVAGRLQSSASSLAGAGKGIASFKRETDTAKRGFQDLQKTIESLKQEMKITPANTAGFKRLERELTSNSRAASNLKKELSSIKFEGLEKGLGKVTGGLISLNKSILGLTFGFLIDSIKRVYELQERWTNAIGGFNMKIGGMTSGLKGAQKAATQWSSTVRGLTNGDINEGIQMFGEFTMAIGRTVKSGDEFSKFGVQLARGFGIGGAAAGTLAQTFENIGMSADDSAEAMKTAIKAANQAGIPVNMLAEDLSKSTDYMARFGKEGQKTLIQGAAWARKYDIALDQLKNSVEGFDTFDEAAKSASKLNSTFGTMINSMDLMMEDDPAKRLDTIRQQMLAQGMTYDKLTPKQVRYFTETMKLTEKQTAAILSSQNAGESYTEFAAKAAAEEKKELSAKKMMEKQLRATAQTMYAFGMAFDRITIAIGKAIRPLLEVFGLARKGGKDMTSFGGVMENITKTVEKFFVSLSENEDWNKFMITLARDIKKAGSALKDFVMSGKAAELVGDIAVAMKKFYGWVRDVGVMAGKALKPLIPVFVTLTEHLDLLVAAWAGMKAFNLAKSFKAPDSGNQQSGSSAQQQNAGFSVMQPNKKSRGFGRMRQGIAGGVMAGATTMMEGGGAGASIGGAIGSIAGAFVPFIGPLLGPLGSILGKGIESLFKGGKSKLEKAQDRLTAATKDAANASKMLQATQDLSEARMRSQDARRDNADKTLLSLKKKQISLSDEEKISAIERVKQLQGFGISSEKAAGMIDMINKSGQLTPPMLKDIAVSSETYNSKLMALRESTDAMTQANMNSREIMIAKQDVEAKKIAIARADLDIEKLNKQRDKELTEVNKSSLSSYNKPGEDLSELELYARKKDKYDRIQGALNKKIEELKLSKIENQTKIEESSLLVNKKMLIATQRGDALKSDLFMKFKEERKSLGIDEAGLASMFFTEQSKQIKEYLGLEGEGGQSQYNDILTGGGGPPRVPLARGGVVTRPTRALIGEAGPEAVIPLSKMRQNMLSSPTSKNETMVTQIAEVTLDGQKVGRALVRSTIRGRN